MLAQETEDAKLSKTLVGENALTTLESNAVVLDGMDDAIATMRCVGDDGRQTQVA